MPTDRARRPARRHRFVGILSALLLAGAAPAAPSPADIQSPGYQRLQVGAMRVTALYDGYIPIPPAILAGLSEQEMGDLLEQDHQPRGGDARTAIIGFLVEREGRTILIDTGAGTVFGPGAGRLVDNLRLAGFDPAVIDDIFITHLHGDHESGLLTPDGKIVFPKAKVHAAAEDIAYWLDPAEMKRAGEGRDLLFRWATHALEPYRKAGRLIGYRAGADSVPGVTIMPAHGHTPGHSAIMLQDGDARILFWGDTVHSPSIQLARPQVNFAYDTDAAASRASRAALFDMAVKERVLIGASHMPFPGLGYLGQTSDGFVWKPVHYAPLP